MTAPPPANLMPYRGPGHAICPLVRPIAAALAGMMALGACGGGDDTAAPTTTTAGPAPTEAPSTTVSQTTEAPPTTAGAAAPTTTPAPPVTTATTRPSPAGVTALPAGDPASVATALAEAEPALREPGTTPAQFERLGKAQQVAYRQLVANPGWLEDVVRRLPSALDPVVRANVVAGSELRALTKPRTELPPWRIVAPAPADELLGYYKEAEARYRVPWAYLAAIHLTETRMGRIRGTSTAGAQGPMQFLPATWAQYGEGGDINSNRDAIMAAARYLVRNGAPEDMANALFNYNRSQRYVRAVTEYALLMLNHEGAYRGYYHWDVYYRLVDGDRLLPVGYSG
jgi:hypothetical protein